MQQQQYPKDTEKEQGQLKKRSENENLVDNVLLKSLSIIDDLKREKQAYQPKNINKCVSFNPRQVVRGVRGQPNNQITPPKSVPKSFDNQLITLDWLTVNYASFALSILADKLEGKETPEKLPIECVYTCLDNVFTFIDKENDKVVGIKIPKLQRTLHFNRRMEVLVNGDLLASIVFEPLHNMIFAPDDLQLKVGHKFLSLGGWLENLKYIEEFLQLKLKSISRFDIAIDSSTQKYIGVVGAGGDVLKKGAVQGIVNFCNKVHLAFLNNKKRCTVLKGRAVLRPVSESLCPKTRQYSSWRVGKGDKMARIYNKSLELLKPEYAEKKEYTELRWDRGGLDYSEGVDRTEIQVKGKEVQRIEGLTLENLNDPEYLKALYKLLTVKDKETKKGCNFLEFAKVPNSKKKLSRCPIVTLIDFDKLGGSDQVIEFKPKRLSNDIHGAKTSIKHHYVRYVVFGSNDDLRTVQKAINDYESAGLKEWALLRLEKWHSEIKKIVLLKDGEIIQDTALMPLKSIPKIDKGIEVKGGVVAKYSRSELMQYLFTGGCVSRTKKTIVNALLLDGSMKKDEALAKIKALEKYGYITPILTGLHIEKRLIA